MNYEQMAKEHFIGQYPDALAESIYLINDKTIGGVIPSESAMGDWVEVLVPENFFSREEMQKKEVILYKWRLGVYGMLPPAIGYHDHLVVGKKMISIPKAVFANPHGMSWRPERGEWAETAGGSPALPDEKFETLSPRFCSSCKSEYLPTTEYALEYFSSRGGDWCWPCHDDFYDCCYGPGRGGYAYNSPPNSPPVAL